MRQPGLNGQKKRGAGRGGSQCPLGLREREGEHGHTPTRGVVLVRLPRRPPRSISRRRRHRWCTDIGKLQPETGAACTDMPRRRCACAPGARPPARARAAARCTCTTVFFSTATTATTGRGGAGRASPPGPEMHHHGPDGVTRRVRPRVLGAAVRHHAAQAAAPHPRGLAARGAWARPLRLNIAGHEQTLHRYISVTTAAKKDATAAHRPPRGRPASPP
eukprot:COSAG01_NODE_6645_length_3566_cov_2.581194_1_plen_218_part_10